MMRQKDSDYVAAAAGLSLELVKGSDINTRPVLLCVNSEERLGAGERSKKLADG